MRLCLFQFLSDSNKNKLSLQAEKLAGLIVYVSVSVYVSVYVSAGYL